MSVWVPVWVAVCSVSACVGDSVSVCVSACVGGSVSACVSACVGDSMSACVGACVCAIVSACVSELYSVRMQGLDMVNSGG